MTVKELVDVTSRCITINCFKEYTNAYDEYSEKNASMFNDKEVSMIDLPNSLEMNIYYK